MKAVGYLGLLMSGFFVFAGIYISVSQMLPPPPPVFGHEWTFFMENPQYFNYLVTLLLIAYGIFRFVRSYKMIRNNEQ